MYASINFNHQESLMTVEIRDIASQRMLAAEFSSSKFPVAKHIPECRLHFDSGCAQPSGYLRHMFRCPGFFQINGPLIVLHRNLQAHLSSWERGRG